MAQDLYIITDKYQMLELRKIIAEKGLPEAFRSSWLYESTLPDAFTAGRFKADHYDFFDEHFSGYPRELWPLYVKAVAHYQSTEPEVDLISHLQEDPEMACYVAKELSMNLAAEASKAKKLTMDLKKANNDLAVQSNNVKDLTTKLTSEEIKISDLTIRLVREKENVTAVNDKIHVIEQLLQEAASITKVVSQDAQQQGDGW
jgi:hypothetical protein